MSAAATTTSSIPILHGYWRSSAAWRVRIVLNLKGVPARQLPHHLRRQEQSSPSYRAIAPQGLVPAFEVEPGLVLTQSLAIADYLDERHPAPPLLPSSPSDRARVRAVALAIACEIHPLHNLRTLARLRRLGINEEAVTGWIRDVIAEGLQACEAMVARQGPFCFGASPTLADVCLVPQLGSAARFGVTCDWPRLLEANAACAAHDAFARARPEVQSDAEPSA